MAMAMPSVPFETLGLSAASCAASNTTTGQAHGENLGNAAMPTNTSWPTLTASAYPPAAGGDPGHAHGGNLKHASPEKPEPAAGGNPGHAHAFPTPDTDYGHAPWGKRRRLAPTPSIDPDATAMLQQSVRERELSAADLRTRGGLSKLAAEHVQNFTKLMGPGATKRDIAPRFKFRIGTACSGSAADILSMLAIQEAMAKEDQAGFEFEYVFNCEKNASKRNWILALHNVLSGSDHTAHGHGNDTPTGPCLFEDIQDLKKGKCKCFAHRQRAKKGVGVKGGVSKMVPGECVVQDIHGLWCSTSCRDFSKNNSKKHSTTILGDDDPGGGSVLTFNGLCDLMEMLRPDIVIWKT